MIGRIVVHTVYVIIIIMCYFIVSCIPVKILIKVLKMKKKKKKTLCSYVIF